MVNGSTVIGEGTLAGDFIKDEGIVTVLEVIRLNYLDWLGR